MSQNSQICLAIESSCDETAVAFVHDTGWVQDQVLLSQIDIHKKYGGVIPELASRSHFESLSSLVDELFLRNPQTKKTDIKFVAATRAPGLIGPLLVGASFAEGFAKGLRVPLVGVHHLRGHLAANFLSDQQRSTSLKDQANSELPSLVLLVSGGHTSILTVEPDLSAKEIIRTVDDAAGECFDKSAKLLGLDYPGGPAIEKLASEFKLKTTEILKKLPSPKTQDGHFSFSGLKTSIRLLIESEYEETRKSEFCWAIQEAIGTALSNGFERAMKSVKTQNTHAFKNLIFCGGVAANLVLRKKIETIAAEYGLDFKAPPISYCTDNAAMIGAAAWIQNEQFNLKETSPRWALT